jgi:hypothetical protein
MATTFTYTPLVGLDNIVALAGVPQIFNGAPTLIAKDTGQGNGRTGHMRTAFILNNSDGSTAGDTAVTFSVHCPIPFDLATEKTDYSKYFPLCTVTPRTPAGNAFPAAAINCRITAGEATVAGQVPITIAFTAPGGGLDVSYNVDVDFSHTSVS